MTVKNNNYYHENILNKNDLFNMNFSGGEKWKEIFKNYFKKKKNKNYYCNNCSITDIEKLLDKINNLILSNGNNNYLIYKFLLKFERKYIFFHKKQISFFTSFKKTQCNSIFNYLFIYLYMILFWINSLYNNNNYNYNYLIWIKQKIIPQNSKEIYNKKLYDILLNKYTNKIILTNNEWDSLNINLSINNHYIKINEYYYTPLYRIDDNFILHNNISYFNDLYELEKSSVYEFEKKNKEWNKNIESYIKLFSRYIKIINSFLIFITENNKINTINSLYILKTCFKTNSLLFNYECNEHTNDNLNKIYCIFMDYKRKVNNIISFILIIYLIISDICYNYWNNLIYKLNINIPNEYINNSDFDNTFFHLKKLKVSNENIKIFKNLSIIQENKNFIKKIRNRYFSEYNIIDSNTINSSINIWYNFKENNNNNFDNQLNKIPTGIIIPAYNFSQKIHVPTPPPSSPITSKLT